jgi:hypothetical protein
VARRFERALLSINSLLLLNNTCYSSSAPRKVEWSSQPFHHYHHHHGDSESSCTTLEGLHDSARLAPLSIQSYTICERIQRPRPSLLYRYKNGYWRACSPVPAGTTVQIALTILSRGNHTRILHDKLINEDFVNNDNSSRPFRAFQVRTETEFIILQSPLDSVTIGAATEPFSRPYKPQKQVYENGWRIGESSVLFELFETVFGPFQAEIAAETPLSLRNKTSKLRTLRIHRIHRSYASECLNRRTDP